ncbi:uncharacterized protein PHACADRAFT_207577 [Phanerochaete carnosa HHB-10118-sp]|uniref:DUF6533 domain-containing protein n=1 Tax=Phanerochaete carnosa (strain HHB-10118-sp) TaxID=650164 RepID=K5WBH0_PHACS|nr:uncharacterized protein PHACADRAFT_207577 [Phanerochaete carnosa HHB-10118-sp]EKM56299.1 hypothetical protein PHACADRAFT_207577 [Phanerochaete carnosa HHB-10118-sp]
MAQSNESLQQELQEELTGNYVTSSVLCLVIYEYLITLNQEVAVGWRRKFSLASVLLITTRWIMVLGPILAATPSTQTWCTAQVSLFSALRVYALWQGSWMRYVYLVVVLMLGLVPIGTNIFKWTHTVLSFLNTPQVIECIDSTNISLKLGTESESALLKFTLLKIVYMCCAVLYFTRCSLIVADIIVLVLTWIKSFAHFKEMHRLNLRLSISAVLLPDGNILLALNIWDLLTYTNPSLGDAANYADIFVLYMPPLLVQRFMLNLRQLNHTASQSSSDPQHFSRFSVSFRVPSDLLGNIGEPLDHGQSERVEGDDNNNSCAVEESRNEIMENFEHQPCLSSAYHNESIELCDALALEPTGHASDDDVVRSSAYLHEMVAGPSTSA